jgi:hypothetical protein
MDLDKTMRCCRHHNGQRQHLKEKLGLLTETLLELSDTAAGIKNLLLACVERVACAAYVSVDCAALLGAARGELIATAASHLSLYVLWMNVCLHGSAPLGQCAIGSNNSDVIREPINFPSVPPIWAFNKIARYLRQTQTTSGIV